MPFQKGNRANPGGRRKLTDNDRALLAGSTSKAIKRQVELMDSDDGQVAIRATNAVLDRYYGKPIQSVDLEATVGEHDPFEGMTDDQISRIEAVMDEGELKEGDDGDSGEN